MNHSKKNIPADCYCCIINQARSTVKYADLNELDSLEVIETAMRWLIISRHETIQVQQIVRKVTDETLKKCHSSNNDIYAKVKKSSNEIALSFVNTFQKQLDQSETPLELGIRIAAAGNIIDFGAKDHAQLDIAKELSIVNDLKFGKYDFHTFVDRLKTTQKLLFICDNAGEIVFDKILMRVIKSIYPTIQIVAAFRHIPIINDATIEDAMDIGMQEYAKIISSGSVYPGTILGETSSQFRENYANADLIISKGQGNFETLLNEADERVFFLLRIKCETMAKLSGQQKGDLVLLQGGLQ